MPTRSAISHVRNLTLAVVLALAAPAAPGIAATQEKVQRLSLDQALAATVHALHSQRPRLAFDLTQGLLQADPRNPLLHYLQADALAQMKQPGAARSAAARAYRFADSGPDRFRAAQMAARSALAAGQPTRAQFWLRMTALHAPDERAETLIARDYRILRRINPWTFRLRAELRPSDNVNNGADSARQIIEGDPVIGTLSPAAQALPGTIGVLDISTAYRFNRSDRAESAIAGRLYVQRVALSPSAQAAAPSLRNSDLATTYGEIALRHAIATGTGSRKGIVSAQAVIGTSWSAGERSYDLARIELSRSWQMGRNEVTLGGLMETRFSARFRTQDADILGLSAQIAHPFDNGDRLTFSIAHRDTRAASQNGTFRASSLRLNYDIAQMIGPARLSFGLTLGQTNYPTYLLFLPSLGQLGPVAGGRNETSAYGDVSVSFDQYDLAGFAPVLRLRAGRKRSNISRFDIRETSISLGFQSKF